MNKLWKTLTVEKHGPHVLSILLNRPQVLNAFSTQMARELGETFRGKSGDDDVRCIVLGASGEHFCVGADLKERNHLTTEEWKAQHRIFRQATDAILACPVPVIAANHGYCVGAGLELSLCADMMVATPDTTYALPETKLGIFPGIGGLPLMARLGGTTFAKSMIFTGRMVPSYEMHARGVVQWIDDNPREKALSVADAVAQNAPKAVKRAKRALNADMASPLHDSMVTSLRLYMECAESEERKEGVAAFVEKRAPVW